MARGEMGSLLLTRAIYAYRAHWTIRANTKVYGINDEQRCQHKKGYKRMSKYYEKMLRN